MKTTMFLFSNIVLMALMMNAGVAPVASLQLDYYSESCPSVELIILSIVHELYRQQPRIAPALIRLFFHDCFVQGCDASILLDPVDGVNNTEKDARPNHSLRGFDEIDLIKSRLEEACPGVVSCADIISLAARDSMVLVGGPFYPLETGRLDGTESLAESAYHDLPSPFDDLNQILHSFRSKGFDVRDTVSLLGAHSTGTIHCNFIVNRLHNFNGTNEPDPSIDAEFLEQLRSTCNSSSSVASLQRLGVRMDFEGPGNDFGVLYYRSLLEGRGILMSDQQLMASTQTANFVERYATDGIDFRMDFARALIKLSELQNVRGGGGEVRLNCREVKDKLF